MNEQDPIHINELVYKSLDNNISQAECELLNNLVVSDAEAAAYYVKMVRLHWGLRRVIRLCQLPTPVFPEKLFSDFSLEELAAYEKIAPSIPIHEPEPPMPSPVVPKLTCHRPPVRRRIHKSTIFSLVVSAAAIVFVILFVQLAPVQSVMEVATLSDSINAKWDSTGMKMETGARFVTGLDKWMIREGLAELLFDNDTRVVIEGPAEFELLTNDQMKLNYGKLYAVVPQQAYGFTVFTQNSRVIDLGTEFGLRAELDGDMEVHVTKGQVNLLSGLQDKRMNVTVQAGSAKALNAASAELHDVVCNDYLFARDINSNTSLVWRGEKTIDLADVVGGGSGLGTGKRGSSINAYTGQWESVSRITNQLAPQNTSDETGNAEKKTFNYALVANAFVDGVFVPDGENGPVRVSSLGHTCDQIPDTTGTNWGGIIHVEQVLRKQIALNETRYGTPECPALFMHANGAITFDLEQLRQAFSGCQLTTFETVYGISDNYPEVGREPCADFWVLVDGQVKFVRKNVRVHQGDAIEISLSDDDRFLTLMTTDAGEAATATAQVRESFNDWCVFGEPKLRFR